MNSVLVEERYLPRHGASQITIETASSMLTSSEPISSVFKAVRIIHLLREKHNGRDEQ